MVREKAAQTDKKLYSGTVNVPRELTGKAYRLVAEEEHPIVRRPLREVPIADWMDALYDLQDTLMLTVEDDID